MDITLENIVSPLELKVKKEGDKKYKLSVYEYFRWQPDLLPAYLSKAYFNQLNEILSYSKKKGRNTKSNRNTIAPVSNKHSIAYVITKKKTYKNSQTNSGEKIISKDENFSDNKWKWVIFELQKLPALN